MSNDIEREAFEDALVGEAYFWWIPEVGQYRSTITQKMWQTWRRARAQQGEAEPVGYTSKLGLAALRDGKEDARAHIHPERDGRASVAVYTKPPTATGGVPKLTGQHHDLKTDHGVFRQSINGTKPWEIRRNDRNFKVGDTVTLYETVSTGEEMRNGDSLEYTGRTHTGIIGFVLEGPVYGIANDWCVFSLIAAAPSPEQGQVAPGSGWMPTLDWGVMRCDALMEQGFDRVRLDVLKQTFLNAIEANRPNPPAEGEA